MSSTPSKPCEAGDVIFVTGATGFVGSHVVVNLLERGFRVRAGVRSLPNEASYVFLKNYDYDNKLLEFFEVGELPASLEIFSKAVEGCTGVVHVASPMLLSPKNFETEMRVPAEVGTTNLCEAAKRSGTVRRVVLTSSNTAVSTRFPEWRRRKYDAEKDWSEEASTTIYPYAYSKVLASRAAMKTLKDTPEIGLVILCFPSIIGFQLGDEARRKSQVPATTRQTILDLFNGKIPFLVDMGISFADVRDVAEAHARALERPNANGRYVGYSGTVKIADIVTIARKKCANEVHLRFPANLTLPKPLMRFSLNYLAGLDYGTRQGALCQLGAYPEFDMTRSARDLGEDLYRPSEELITGVIMEATALKIFKSKNGDRKKSTTTTGGPGGAG